MKQIIFTAFTAFLALWLEVSLANLGLVVPLVMQQIFYITIVRGWQWGLTTALVVCAPLDSLLGYLSLPSVLAVIIVASFWRDIGDCSRHKLQALPIGLATLCGIFILFVLIIFKYNMSWQWFSWSAQFAGAVLIISLTSPLIIQLQDNLARKMQISTYADRQKTELYNAPSQ